MKEEIIGAVIYCPNHEERKQRIKLTETGWQCSVCYPLYDQTTK